ncbi:hypothetical protein MVEN_01568200 [Mycena venus]|uniref:Uncharacterized protein n=1 Tax=Mycena venus TaxID=2733690 RepID=A0A8H6XQX9_9AGAR|nr:hypothetical protein MVEN_01568200 [Mycena venus]
MATPSFDAWARTTKSTIVLAGNTKEVPDIPQWNSTLVETPRPCIDGRWGLFEYSIVPQLFDPAFPYLAWMPTQKFTRLALPTKINSFRVVEDPSSPNSVFVRHPGWMHRGHLSTRIREELQKDVVYYIDLVSKIIGLEANPSTRVGTPETRPPVIALVRAHNSAFCTRLPHLTYRDLLEYIAGLQRAAAELQAYSLWHDRMQYSDLASTTRSFELGLRGSIARTPEEYRLLLRLGAPVWLEIPLSSTNGLDAAKETKLATMRVERRTWEEMPVSPFLRNSRNGILVHNKPLEYYPPVVSDTTSSRYEAAARGYLPREDVLNQDLRALEDVMHMVESIGLSGANHNKSAALATKVRAAGNTAGELMERYAADRAISPTADAVIPRSSTPRSSGEGQSKWLRQYRDTQSRYEATPWAPQFVEAWGLTRHNSDYYPLIHDIPLDPKCADLLLYIAPPPHLFLGVQNPRKQCTFFFIWMCIRRPWLARMRQSLNDAVSWGLTTQTWRNILSGHYWKLRHPANESSPFEIRKFWKFGGPLVFVEDETTAAEEDISPELIGSPGGRLELDDLKDDSIKALILWDLALCHAQLQLDRTDEILYAARLKDQAKLSIRRTRRADLFHNPDWNWTIPRESPPWEKPLSHSSRRHWLSRLLEVVKDWPCASKMGWFLAENKFDIIKSGAGRRAEQVFCESLAEGRLHMLELSLVAVYYQGVFDAMGILAVGVTQRPAHTASMEPFYLM